MLQMPFVVINDLVTNQFNLGYGNVPSMYTVGPRTERPQAERTSQLNDF